MTDPDPDPARHLAAAGIVPAVVLCPKIPPGVIYIDPRPAGSPCLWCDVVHLSLDGLLAEILP